MPWQDVTKTDKFRSLEQKDRALVKDEYFRYKLLPQLQEKTQDPSVLDEAYNEFMERPDDTGEGLLRSAVGSAARGFLDPLAAVPEVAGAFTGIESLEELGGDIRSGIERMAPVNPAQEGFVTDLAGVAGQVGQIAATGGLGAASGISLAGKAATKAAQLRAASLGARTAQQGAMGASAVAGGLERADQLGLEGGDRLIRGLLAGGTELATEKLGGFASELGPINKFLGGSVESGWFEPIKRGILTESGEEMGAEMAGQLTDIAMSDKAPAMDLKQIAYAGLLGGAGGAMFGGVEAAIAPKTSKAFMESGAFVPARSFDQLPDDVREAVRAGDESRIVSDAQDNLIGYKPKAPEATVETELPYEAPIEIDVDKQLPPEVQPEVEAMVVNVAETPETSATAAALAEDAGAIAAEIAVTEPEVLPAEQAAGEAVADRTLNYQGKELPYTINVTRADDGGYKVTGIKVQVGNGFYERIPFPQDEQTSFASADEARAAADQFVQASSGNALPQQKPIETQENAIQEQITDESLLRQGRPEMGLQEMGQGNAQVQEAAGEGQAQEVQVADPIARMAAAGASKVVVGADGQIDRAATQEKLQAEADALGISLEELGNLQASDVVESKQAFWDSLTDGDVVTWTDSNGRTRTAEVEVTKRGTKSVVTDNGYELDPRTNEFITNADTLSVSNPKQQPNVPLQETPLQQEQSSVEAVPLPRELPILPAEPTAQAPEAAVGADAAELEQQWQDSPQFAAAEEAAAAGDMEQADAIEAGWRAENQPISPEPTGAVPTESLPAGQPMSGDMGEQGGQVVSQSGQNVSFGVDEQLLMHSPFTDEDSSVSFRGVMPDGKAVVWTGKTQMAVPLEWLRRAGEPLPVSEVKAGGANISAITQESQPEQSVTAPTDRQQPLPLPKTKDGLIAELVGPIKSDYVARQAQQKTINSYKKFSKEELLEKVKDQRVSDAKFKRRQEVTIQIIEKIKGPVNDAGTGWVKLIKEIAKANGIEDYSILQGNSRGEEIYRIASRIADRGNPFVNPFINATPPPPQQQQPATPATQETQPEAAAFATVTATKEPTATQQSAEETGDAGVTSASERLRNDIATLPAKAQAAWTPELLAVADSYYSSGDRNLLDKLPKSQRNRILENSVSSEESVALDIQRIAERKQREGKPIDDKLTAEEAVRRSIASITEKPESARAKAIQKGLAGLDWANMDTEQRRAAVSKFAQSTARSLLNGASNLKRDAKLTLHEDRSPSAKFDVSNGSLSIEIGTNVDFDGLSFKDSEEAVLSQVFAAIEEEFMHAAHGIAAFERWKKSGSETEFRDWFEQESFKDWQSIFASIGELRASGNNEAADVIEDTIFEATKLYHQDVPPEMLGAMMQQQRPAYKMYLELARMLAQVQLDSFTTETEFTRFVKAVNHIFTKVLGLMRKSAELVKSGALGEALKRDVDTLASSIRQMRRDAALIEESQKQPPAATYADAASDANVLINSLGEEQLQQGIEMREKAPEPTGLRQSKQQSVAQFSPATEEERKAFNAASSNKVTARNTSLAVAAVRLRNGEITAEQYADLVDVLDPFTLKGAESVPTDQKIKQYIASDKAPQVGGDIPKGKEVEFRIDIPTYNRSTAAGDTVYAVTAHEPVSDKSTRVGTPISYLGIAKVINPSFMTRSISGKGAAIDIATGSGKFPLATVKGIYEPISATPSDINDPSVWTEVGYNPIRSSAFVDVRSKNEVIGGTEAIMVGSRVFVKGAVLQPRATGYTRGERFSILRQNDGSVIRTGVTQRAAEAARNSYDGVIPGVADTWLGTAAEFQEQHPDGIDWGNGTPSQPDADVEAGVAADGRSYVFIDRVQLLEGDMKRAEQYGTTPQGEAVKRLLRHESFGHRGAMSLPAPLRNRFVDMIASGVIPEAELDYIVNERGYSSYAGWRDDVSKQIMLGEEWLAHKMEGIRAIPQSGPMAQMMDWLRDVWAWLTGSEKAMLPELRDMMREMHRALGTLKPEQRVVDGTRASLQQSPLDAEYFAAIEAGDMEKAQAMVDEAARGAGYNVGPVFHGAEAKDITEFTRGKQHEVGVGSLGFFTSSQSRAKDYAGNDGRVYRVYLSAKDAITADYELNEILQRWSREPSYIDGIDAIVTRPTERGDIVAVVRDPNQIKSADPVTYDSSGAPIPPSQRFQSTSNDIRYSRQGPIRNQPAPLTSPETKNTAPNSAIRSIAEMQAGLDGVMEVLPTKYHPLANEKGAQDALKAYADDLIAPYKGSVEKLRKLLSIVKSDVLLSSELKIGARSGSVVMPSLLNKAAILAAKLGNEPLRMAFMRQQTAFASSAGQDLWANKAVKMDTEFSNNYVNIAMDDTDVNSVKVTVDPLINTKGDKTVNDTLDNAKLAGDEAADAVAAALEDEAMISMRVLELGALAQEDAELRGLLEELIATTIDLGELAEADIGRASIAGRRTPLKFANAAERDAAIEKLKTRQTEILTAIKAKLAKPKKTKEPKTEAATKEPKAPKEKQPAKEKEAKPVQTAKQIINKIISAAQRKEKKPADIDMVRELYRLDLKKPMNEAAFLLKAKIAGLDLELAKELKDAIDLELTAIAIEAAFRAESSEQDRAIKKAEEELNRYQKQAESKINEIADALADPSLTKDKQKAINPFKVLYDQQIKNPLSMEQFVIEMSKLNVFEQTAKQLFDIAAMDAQAREAIQAAKDDARIAATNLKKRNVSEARASELIYAQEEQLRQGSKDREESKSGDSINKAFRDQVSKPMALDAFIARLDKLKVSAKTAERLFKTAGRVAMDDEMADLMKKRNAFLDIDSSALAAFVNKMRASGKMTGEKKAKWGDILSLPVADQETMRAELLDRISKHDALRNLSTGEQIALADALDAVWQRERRKIFKRMIKRADMKGVDKATQEKIANATPALLKFINQGMLGSDAFYLALGEQFNIQRISKEDRAKVEQLAAEMQAPDVSTMERTIKSEQIAKILQKNSTMSYAELASSVWVVHVLTGGATLLDMGLGFMTGALSVIKKAINVAAIGKPGLALQGLSDFGRFLWIAGKEAIGNVVRPESGILAAKEASMMAYMQKGAMGAGLTPGDRLQLIRDEPGDSASVKANKKIQRTLGRWLSMWERIMGGLDHFNSVATTHGTMRLAAALNPKLYDEALIPSHQDYKNMMVRAKARMPDGTPKAQSALARSMIYDGVHLLGKGLEEGKMEQWRGMVFDIRGEGFTASFQEDPSGLGGILYNGIKSMTDGLEVKTREFRDKQREKFKETRGVGPATLINRAAGEMGYVLATQAQNIMGSRFIRFTGNKLNELISYTPFIGLARLQEAGMSRDGLTNLRAKNIYHNQALSIVALIAYMYMMQRLDDDEEEKKVIVEGSWDNLTPARKSQLMSDGFKPNTIRFKMSNGQWVSGNFTSWPFAGWLAAFGTVSDYKRYTPAKWTEKEAMDKTMLALYSGAFAITDISSLSQLMEMFGKSTYSTDPVKTANERLIKGGTSFLGGFVPRIAKDIDSWFDHTAYKPKDTWGHLAKEVPYLRRSSGAPVRDIFYEKVEVTRSPWSRAIKVSPDDPAYQKLARLNSRGIWLTPPNPENRKVRRGGATRALTEDEAAAYMSETGAKYKEFIMKRGDALAKMDADRAADLIEKTTARIREIALKRAIARGGKAVTVEAE